MPDGKQLPRDKDTGFHFRAWSSYYRQPTYATMLFDAGVDVKSAQRFLGHTDVEVTLSIYTHLTKFKEEQAIQKLDEHIREKKNEPVKRLLHVL